MVDDYQSEVYLGSATLFRSERVSSYPGTNDDLGWSEYIRDRLDIVKLRGDHISMVIEPRNMKVLASEIMKVVNKQHLTMYSE